MCEEAGYSATMSLNFGERAIDEHTGQEAISQKIIRVTKYVFYTT